MKRSSASRVVLIAPTLSAMLGLSATLGCTIDVRVILDGDDGAEAGDELTEAEDDGGSESPGVADLPADAEPEPQPLCRIPSGELNGNLPCELEPPSDSIAPIIAWTWTGPAGEDSVVTTPLVANLDDDNGDGFVDLCDTPEIIVAAVDLPPNKHDVWPAGHLHVIAGDGSGSWKIPTPIDAAINPALGDLDGDGTVEIVALQALAPNSPYTISSRRLVALSATGELLWLGEHLQASRGGGALAIADLDGDGSPEILAPEYVATAEGALAWTIDDPPLAFSMPVAVDLDLDGRLEVLFGASAYAADGTWLFTAGSIPKNRGSVAVANFDGDPHPELYLQFDGQHGVFEHDGTLVAACPTAADLPVSGGYPIAIHDLDGDGRAELVFGLNDRFYVLGLESGDCSLRWSKKVDTDIGSSSGTVFDLLGDGKAEAIYADRSRVQLFSSAGDLLFMVPRSARESITNPIVVDVDGDGAAEIVIASSEPLAGQAEDMPPSPTLLVLENADDRFAPTRRVWNQHTYHHSNILEDGRVPVEEAPHWLLENSFRSNSRAQSGDSCIPPALHSRGE